MAFMCANVAPLIKHWNEPSAHCSKILCNSSTSEIKGNFRRFLPPIENMNFYLVLIKQLVKLLRGVPYTKCDNLGEPFVLLIMMAIRFANIA